MTKNRTHPFKTSRSQAVRELARRLEKIVATRHSGSRRESVPTGISALDALLPGGGFRRGTLVEWLADFAAADWLTWATVQSALGDDGVAIVVDVESVFYPPAAVAAGLDLKRLVLVRPRTAAEALWAVEQSLQSRGVAVTFCQFERLSNRVFRRFQLAAERGGGIGVLLRPVAAGREPSWSDVRLGVQSVGNPSPKRQWHVEVLQCQGRAIDRAVLLEYDDVTHSVHLASPLASSVSGKQAARA